jgi:hypothetical protein
MSRGSNSGGEGMEIDYPSGDESEGNRLDVSGDDGSDQEMEHMSDSENEASDGFDSYDVCSEEGTALSKEAAELYSDYPRSHDNGYESDKSFDSQNRDYEAERAEVEDNEELQKERAAFWFENRDHPNITEVTRLISQEKGDSADLSEEGYVDDVQSMLFYAIREGNDDILYDISEKLSDDELLDLGLDLVEQLAGWDSSIKGRLEKAKHTVNLAAVHKLDFDQLQNINFFDDFEEEQLHELQDAFVRVLSDQKEAETMSEILAFIIAKNLWDDVDFIQDAINIIIEKVIAGEYQLDQVIEYSIENSFVYDSDEEHEFDIISYIDFYIKEHSATTTITKQLQEIIGIALDKEKYDYALRAYDIIQTTEYQITINNPQMVDAFLSGKRLEEARELFETHRQQLEEQGGDMEDTHMHDASTNPTALSIRRRKYDLSEQVGKLTNTDDKLVLISHAIAKSIVFSQEVNHCYYSQQKKLLGVNQLINQQLFRQWVKILLQESIADSEHIAFQQQESDKVEKQLIESGEALIRYMRFISIGDEPRKGNNKKGIKAEHAEHFYNSAEAKESGSIAQQKIHQILQSLFTNEQVEKGDYASFIDFFDKQLRVNRNQEILQRATLKEAHNENITHKDLVDLFANIRLLRRTAINEITNKLLSRNSIGSESTRVIKVSFIGNSKIPQIDCEQKRSSHDGLDYYSKNLGSYPKIYEKLKTFITQFKLSEQDVASFIRCVLQGKDALLKADDTVFNHRKIADFSEFVASLTVLIFYVEGSRNHASFIMQQMMLDLIIANKMTFKQAFSDLEMPMAMKDAVPEARGLVRKFSKSLPYEAPHYGTSSYPAENPDFDKAKKPHKSKNPKTRTIESQGDVLLKKEATLILKWCRLREIKRLDQFITVMHESVKGWYPGINVENVASFPKKKEKEQEKEQDKKSSHKRGEKHKKRDNEEKQKMPDSMLRIRDLFAENDLLQNYIKHRVGQNAEQYQERLTIDGARVENIKQSNKPYVVITSSTETNAEQERQLIRGLNDVHIGANRNYFIINNHGVHWNMTKVAESKEENIEASGKDNACGCYTIMHIIAANRESVSATNISWALPEGASLDDLLKNGVNELWPQTVRGFVGNLILQSSKENRQEMAERVCSLKKYELSTDDIMAALDGLEIHYVERANLDRLSQGFNVQDHQHRINRIYSIFACIGSDNNQRSDILYENELNDLRNFMVRNGANDADIALAMGKIGGDPAINAQYQSSSSTPCRKM